jgi:hypothetical protein
MVPGAKSPSVQESVVKRKGCYRQLSPSARCGLGLIEPTGLSRRKNSWHIFFLPVTLEVSFRHSYGIAITGHWGCGINIA